MNRLVNLSLFLCLILLLLGAFPRLVLADGEAKTITKLKLETREVPDAHQVRLVARLTNAEGRALSNQVIEFYVFADFVGKERSVNLGSASTDSAGTASMLYSPATKGTHRLGAKFAGNSSMAPGSADTSLDVVSAAPLYEREPIALEPVLMGTTIAVGVVTLVVWGLLVGVIVRVVRGLPALAKTEPARFQSANRD